MREDGRKALEFETRARIGPAWAEGESGRFAVHDPATGETLCEVADCSVAQTESAIEAAHAAWPQWRSATAEARAEALRKLAQAMHANETRLARIMTREQGKPLAEAAGEVRYAAGFIAWAAEEGKRIYGETIPSPKAGKRIWVHRQPVGVVAAITPWNFPLAMITRKIGPALAVGCTAVVKPAELTPLSALALMELAVEAGLPPGVLNVVTTSDAEAHGKAILGDARVRKVSFTGSTEVGKWLVRAAAEHLPRLSLELGGHAPAIVFDDADLDQAVEEIVAAKFRNCGQTCVCVNRIYVQRPVAEAFMQKLAARLEALRVGPGMDPAAEIGPLVDRATFEKVERHVADARARGAKLVCGGQALPELGPTYYAPTLLTEVDHEMLVMREETFGPVAPVCVFDEEQQAIDWANDTDFGLAAYFFSRGVARCFRVGEALEYGIVGINDGRPSTPEAPFGGFKQSGWGREGGKYAMDAYLETKYLSWSL